MMEKQCGYCGETKPVSEFNFRGKPGLRGLNQYRARCKFCENVGRLGAKRGKLKGSKNLISTHGGSSRSPQKVVG